MNQHLIQGVAFDGDGVLFDTEGFQYRGWRDVLAKHRKQFSAHEYRPFAGSSGRAVAPLLFSKFGIDADVSVFLAEKNELVRGFLEKEEIKLMPYAVDALETCLSYNIPFALVSSAPKDEISLKLRKTHLDSFFSADQIVSLEDVSVPKPAPDAYRLFKRRLNIEYGGGFEDTGVGAEAVAAAGLVPYVIPSWWTEEHTFPPGSKRFDSLEEACAEMIIHFQPSR